MWAYPYLILERGLVLKVFIQRGLVSELMIEQGEVFPPLTIGEVHEQLDLPEVAESQPVEQANRLQVSGDRDDAQRPDPPASALRR